MVFSAWQPSKEEIVALQAGAMVWLMQRGAFIPEMALQVGRQEDVVPVDVLREAVSPPKIEQELINRVTEERRKKVREEKLRDWGLVLLGAAFYAFGAALALLGLWGFCRLVVAL